MNLTVEPEPKKLQIAFNPPPEPAEKVKMLVLALHRKWCVFIWLARQKTKTQPEATPLDVCSGITVVHQLRETLNLQTDTEPKC